MPLRHALLGLIERGEALRLDGAEVARVGQACLQVLVSARTTAIGVPAAGSRAQSKR